MTQHEPGGRSVPPRDDDHSTNDRVGDDHENDNHDHDNDNHNGPAIKVSGTHQLLAVLPHLLGYHPARSLVVVVTEVQGHRGDVGIGQVVFSARMDLPSLATVDAVVSSLTAPLRQVSAGAGTVLLHAFGFDLPDPGPLDAEFAPDLDLPDLDMELADRIEEALTHVAESCGAHLHDLLWVRHRDSGVEVAEAIHGGEIGDEQWRPALSAADVPAAADLVLSGQSARRSREEVVQQVRHLDPAAAEATDLAVSVLSLAPERLDDEEAVRALGAWVVGGEPPTPRQRAWITLVLHDKAVRDAVLARWAPEMFALEDVLDEDGAAQFRGWAPAWEREASGEALDRLLTLVSQVPRSLAAPLVTVTGMLAWLHGEGTVANEACDLALEIDPQHRMAQILRDALERGVRPPRAGGRSPTTLARHHGGRPAA